MRSATSATTERSCSAARRSAGTATRIEERASCSICHDPHGISSTQGNLTNNKFLINFDTRFVTPSNGILRIDDLGGRSVRCYMVCHGENHNGRTCSANSCG